MSTAQATCESRFCRRRFCRDVSISGHVLTSALIPRQRSAWGAFWFLFWKSHLLLGCFSSTASPGLSLQHESSFWHEYWLQVVYKQGQFVPAPCFYSSSPKTTWWALCDKIAGVGIKDDANIQIIHIHAVHRVLFPGEQLRKYQQLATPLSRLDAEYICIYSVENQKLCLVEVNLGLFNRISNVQYEENHVIVATIPVHCPCSQWLKV